ncbi:MAG: glycosyltransferase [Pseudomonadota bacterium]|nr:glycosyltransferase [Pseudomonadota bacterium]
MGKNDLIDGATYEASDPSQGPPSDADLRLAKAQVSGPSPDHDGYSQRRFYLSLPAKFVLALTIALAWTGLSVWLSQRWLHDLAKETDFLFACIAIGFIAYVPGFMNAFLIATLLLDRQPPRQRPYSYPGLTVLVAAYNEVAAIRDTLTSLAAQDYQGALEILVLNDGSTDDTLVLATSSLQVLKLPSNISIRLIDFAVNRGKSAVLNDGLREATHDLIATIDGDSWVRRDGLSQIVERLLSDPANTQAVAGAVMVRNSRENLLTRAQEWDYFHGIAGIKRMQAMYHGTLVAQGAFSLYRRAALDEVGGWPHCVGEDIVVSWALLSKNYRIGYAASALAFTNVPATVRQFALQRKRWSRGLMEAFKAHGRLIVMGRLSTLFIWWNVCFPPLDLVFTFVFIPGLILACFGIFWIAGPMTIAVLPLTILWNTVIYRIQKGMYRGEGLHVRQNNGGFLFYSLAYSLLMQPVCVWGYAAELIGLKKHGIPNRYGQVRDHIGLICAIHRGSSRPGHQSGTRFAASSLCRRLGLVCFRRLRQDRRHKRQRQSRLELQEPRSISGIAYPTSLDHAIPSPNQELRAGLFSLRRQSWPLGVERTSGYRWPDGIGIIHDPRRRPPAERIFRRARYP